jgi:ABC-type dipeptide/oligopeptide/nickel transport system permease subunit
MVAVLLVIVIAGVAVAVPILPLQDPLATDYDRTLESPGSDHIMGTDLHGRDVFSRVLWASRPSLLVGVAATSIALALGILVGGLAGYGGRRTDSVLMRTADVFLSFPVILGAIAVIAVVGPGLRNIFLAIALFGWPVFARLFRSTVLSNRERDYVRAATVMGASDTSVFFRHILPNSVGPLISYTALAVAAAILAEAGLSFINLGVQRPHPSWGLMLAESRGIALTLTTLAFILIGSSANRTIDGGASRRGI